MDFSKYEKLLDTLSEERLTPIGRECFELSSESSELRKKQAEITFKLVDCQMRFEKTHDEIQAEIKLRFKQDVLGELTQLAKHPECDRIFIETCNQEDDDMEKVFEHLLIINNALLGLEQQGIK